MQIMKKLKQTWENQQAVKTSFVGRKKNVD